MREVDKLPQARRYLRAAIWGFENLQSQMIGGAGFIFHIIGILALLRAVPHALILHDCNISPEHRAVISLWKEMTSDTRSIPELQVIIDARNLALKDANFAGYALHTESSTGEGENRIVTREDYELSHWVGGERRDLAKDIQSAIDWLGAELTKLEAQLPPRYEDDSEDDTWDFSDVLPDGIGEGERL